MKMKRAAAAAEASFQSLHLSLTRKSTFAQKSNLIALAQGHPIANATMHTYDVMN